VPTLLFLYSDIFDISFIWYTKSGSKEIKIIQIVEVIIYIIIVFFYDKDRL